MVVFRVLLMMLKVLRLGRSMERKVWLEFCLLSLLHAFCTLSLRLLWRIEIFVRNFIFIRSRTAAATNCGILSRQLRTRRLYCHSLHLRVLCSLFHTNIACLCWNVESTCAFTDCRFVSFSRFWGQSCQACERINIYIILALLWEVSRTLDCSTMGCWGTKVFPRVRLLCKEIFQLHVEAFDEQLSSL